MNHFWTAASFECHAEGGRAVEEGEFRGQKDPSSSRIAAAGWPETLGMHLSGPSQGKRASCLSWGHPEG